MLHLFKETKIYVLRRKNLSLDNISVNLIFIAYFYQK